MNIQELKSSGENITPQQAYLAMYIFLVEQNKMCSNTMEVSEILSICAILEDGGTADPAMLSDWLEAVEKARDDKNWEITRFTLIS